MSEFLLIHGSCFGAWCWQDTIAALQALGHHARAIDLPGRSDSTGVTLDSFATAITSALSRPTILVGHSMAGYPITAAALQDPTQITALIYLCAYLPTPGQSLAQMRRSWPDQPLRPAIRLSPDRASFHFDPAATEALFFHDCPNAAEATARLCPEPVTPQETPLATTPTLPRHYIRCTNDRAIPPAFQTQMAAALPPSHVTTLATGHSPFLAAPEALAQRLHQIAESL